MHNLYIFTFYIQKHVDSFNATTDSYIPKMRVIDVTGIAAPLPKLSDKNYTSCHTIGPDTNGYAWVVYDLGNKIDKTTHVRIIQDTSDVTLSPAWIDVHFGATGRPTDTQCIAGSKFQTNQLTNGTKECDSGNSFTGRFALVVSNTTLNLCEVEFYGQSKFRCSSNSLTLEIISCPFETLNNLQIHLF